MRKTSQDGGDSTSITSGIENEIKKPGVIIKTKRNSIKRKVQNFSHESDDAVIEPLLQKDKEKTDATKPSAKFNLMSKTKTEANNERRSDKDKLISDDKLQKSALPKASDVTDRNFPTSNIKENSKFTSANAPLHNHMNTNVFSSHEGFKGFVAPKSQILVEIDGSKQVGYNPSPLIFTTAKIHTDGKTKNMEPVQMTPAPILSTIEVSVMKSGINTGETSGHVSSNISTVHATIPFSNKNITEQDSKPPFKNVNNTPKPHNIVADTKIQILTDKPGVKNNALDKSSIASSSSKETKLIQAKFSPISVKGNVTENKCIYKDNKIEKEKDEDQAKISSQPTKSSASDKANIPNETTSGLVLAANIKVTSTNYPIKESGIIDQTVKSTTDKSDAYQYSENKTDLNKTVKLKTLDSQKKIQSDNIIADKTSNDKNKENTISSVSSKQLQRQNIVLDKDNPISKLTNDFKGKSVEYQKSYTIEANSVSDKTKLPKPSANSVPITSVKTVPINTSAADNKTSASMATAIAINKKPTPTTSTVTVNKTVASTTTTSNINNTPATTNKISAPISTTAAIRKTSAPITSSAAVNKSSAFISTSIGVNKTSAPTTAAEALNKISAPTTAAGNKISAPITTTVATSKISAPIFTTTATKMTSGSTKPATAVDKISISNSVSSGNPVTTSFSTLPTSLSTPATKTAIVTTSSVSKPLSTGTYPNDASTFGNIKPGTTNESSTTKSQVTSTLNTKPTNSTTTKLAKVSTVANPVTTSQRTTAAKTPAVTTAKSGTTKTISQVTVAKSSEINPKSSTSNENPPTAKSNFTSINSTTTSGISNITTTATSSTLASSGSSSKTADADKQSHSKSKELSNGNKSLKA